MALAADLNVSVTGVRNDQGSIRVAVCDKANFPSGACPFHAEAPAHASETIVHLTGVPQGNFAVAVYHDEAGTKRLELSLLGIPKQGFGFSNDAKMHFGPPSFADASFGLAAEGGSITVPLHYPP